MILTTTQVRTAAHGGRTDAKLAGGLDQMDRVVGELKRRALALRTTPLLRVMENLPRVAREVAQRTGKRVHVTLGGAELDLLIPRGGKRYGFEFKYADAPSVTKSMRAALATLDLEGLFVVYPGDRGFALDKKIEAVPLVNVPARLAAL